jgi:hypothetical protein
VYDEDPDPYDLIDGILEAEETLIDEDMWIK